MSNAKFYNECFHSEGNVNFTKTSHHTTIASQTRQCNTLRCCMGTHTVAIGDKGLSKNTPTVITQS